MITAESSEKREALEAEPAARAPEGASLRERARKWAALVGQWFAWTPVAAAVVVFARLLHLGWYAQPQADDFDYSVLYTRYGFWGAQVKWYYGWNGRYTFNAATTALVAILDIARSYWVIPTAMFAMIVGVHYAAFRKLEKPLHAFAGAIVVSALIGLASPVRSDAYYWATGVTLYPLANCLLVLFLVAGWRLFVAESPRDRWREAALLSVLAFLIIGCNETSMLVLDILVFGMCVVALAGRRATLPHWIVVLVVCAACSLFVVKAPGNAIRESFMTHRGDFKLAFEKTTEQSKTLLWEWATNPLLLVVTLLGWGAAGRVAARARERFPGLGAGWIPVAIALGTALLVWASIFPSWWSKGSMAIPRTLNVSYAVFLLGWAIGVAFLSSLSVVAWDSSFVRVARPCLSAALVYLFLSHDVYAAVVKDLKTTAPQYRRELLQRYRAIREAKQAGERDVVVEPVRNPPSQLYILDLFACTEGWPNSSYAEHFGVRTVRPRGARIGSCGAVPAAARAVVNPYSIHLFRPPE